ncbi:hypothetical protein LguiA_031446 [Lonicera macranthoides]
MRKKWIPSMPYLLNQKEPEIGIVKQQFNFNLYKFTRTVIYCSSSLFESQPTILFTSKN